MRPFKIVVAIPKVFRFALVYNVFLLSLRIETQANAINQLNLFIARSTPEVTIVSTASAAA